MSMNHGVKKRTRSSVLTFSKTRLYLLDDSSSNFMFEVSACKQSSYRFIFAKQISSAEKQKCCIQIEYNF